MKRNENGFTVVEALLIILIIAVIGFGGYYVYHTQHKDRGPKSISTSSNHNAGAAAQQTLSIYDNYLSNGVGKVGQKDFIQQNSKEFTGYFIKSIDAINSDEGDFFLCGNGILPNQANEGSSTLSGNTAAVTVNLSFKNDPQSGTQPVTVDMQYQNNSWLLNSIKCQDGSVF